MHNEMSVTEFSDGGLELAMQELETMDAPWISALVSATAVISGVVISTVVT
jgi:hypothetical protein